MKYTFVGTHPESLASGRPLVFGDQVDAKDLAKADERLGDLLIEQASKSDSTPTPEAK